MLKQLNIRNYALIRELEMQPSGAFNIITGETGAGKSIMLGALGLLMGNRADTKVLFDEEQKCLVEAVFDISGYKLKEVFEENDLDYEAECIVRREISSNGKSRAFINDVPVTLEVLRTVGDFLLDVHSQHDTLLLSSGDYQLSILDNFAGNYDLIVSYKEAFKVYKKADKALKELTENAEKIRQEADYDSFLFKELDEVKLNVEEQEAQEEELKRLENAEEIRTRLDLLLGYLSENEQSVNPVLAVVVSNLDKLASFGHYFNELKTRTQSALYELKDIVAELEVEAEKTEIDPERAAVVKERLSRIYGLQQKHKVQDVAALIAIHQELSVKLQKIQNLDEDLVKAQKVFAQAETAMLDLGKKLTASRASVIGGMETEMKALLADLSMNDAVLKVQLSDIAPSASGLDKVGFLFSANKGVAPQELKSVASGGEFSRLMLCIKYLLAGKMALPTIIFDEIDTGISGDVAVKVANMMKRMSAGHQVIVITHMPQIAAKGDAHFFVYKDNSADRTISNIRLLNNDDRLKEIAQMISGNAQSETALQHARELMA